MTATVQKWGDSLVIRIPNKILESVRISENDKVELQHDENSITICKFSPKVHISLEERLTAFYGKPIESIGLIEQQEEYNLGTSRGDEV